MSLRLHTTSTSTSESDNDNGTIYYDIVILNAGHMQMSMRNGVTPKLKLTLTLTLTLTDTEGAVLTLMLGYRSLYIISNQ